MGNLKAEYKTDYEESTMGCTVIIGLGLPETPTEVGYSPPQEAKA